MKNLEKKSWDDLRATGLILIINTILHAFGYAITFEVDENNKVIDCYPCRTKFRGFSEPDQDEDHTKIANYLAENAPNFPEEIK